MMFNFPNYVNALKDEIGCSKAVETYCDKDPTFTTSRDCRLLNALLEALDSKDITAFSDAW